MKLGKTAIGQNKSQSCKYTDLPIPKIQSIEKGDINKDGEEDLVVLIRSAGSGGYLQAEAFQFVDGKVELIASALDLDPKAKYLEELKSLID
tara:strand:- start:558 stop:833 length:276 start_codon:yes stop_codon:yes gene_type:complete